MYISKNKVRMHDTDMAGILYFPRQFRFAHDALEDFVESEGMDFHSLFHQEDFVFVIVHCEADYFAASNVGDKLEVQLTVGHIGKSSFSINYRIIRDDGVEIGTAKTVHVTLTRSTREKIPIPTQLQTILEKHKSH